MCQAFNVFVLVSLEEAVINKYSYLSSFIWYFHSCWNSIEGQNLWGGIGFVPFQQQLSNLLYSSRCSSIQEQTTSRDPYSQIENVETNKKKRKRYCQNAYIYSENRRKVPGNSYSIASLFGSCWVLDGWLTKLYRSKTRINSQCGVSGNKSTANAWVGKKGTPP